MKSINTDLKNWAMAATFAEAGEWETARMMTPDYKTKTATFSLSKIFAAVAFAEENMHAEAVKIARGSLSKTKKVIFDELEELSLDKIHLRYGTVCLD